MNAAIRLQSFDDATRPSAGVTLSDADETVARRLAQARAEGYAEGAAAALEEVRREDAELLSAIAEALGDVAMVRQEARVSALSEIGAALGALVEALAPAARRDALIEGAAALIETAIASAEDKPVVLKAAPVAIDAMRAALDGAGADQAAVTIECDASMAPGAVAVDWREGGLSLDHDALAAALHDLIETHFPQNDALEPERIRNAG